MEPKLDDVTAALRHVVREIDSFQEQAGWDMPPVLYGLVNVGQVLEADPSLAEVLGAEVLEQARDNPHTLIAVPQEGLPESESLEQSLALVEWDDSIVGCALGLEHLAISDEANESLPDDPQEAMDYVMNHPSKRELRTTAAVLATGERWSLLRGRGFVDDRPIEDPALAPDLTDALAQTLQP